MREVAYASALSAALLLVPAGGAHAQDSAPVYRDVETIYIFGFTTGSGIGLEGEKEFSPETVMRFGKRDGRYTASETKFEFEFTPNQYVQIEFGPMASYHGISGVTDLDDRNRLAFSGVFGEIRYLLLERTSSQPLSVTVSDRKSVV